MKPVLSVLFVLILVIVAVERSSSHVARLNKRYYDAWEPNTDGGGHAIDDSIKGSKGPKKSDLCENKPLWFLKHQARLGKSSPFYNCIIENGLEAKK